MITKLTNRCFGFAKPSHNNNQRNNTKQKKQISKSQNEIEQYKTHSSKKKPTATAKSKNKKRIRKVKIKKRVLGYRKQNIYSKKGKQYEILLYIFIVSYHQFETYIECPCQILTYFNHLSFA